MGFIRWDQPLSQQDVTPADLMTAINGLLAGGGSPSALGRAVPIIVGNWGAADHGLITWSFDPAAATAGTAPTVGTLNLVRVNVKTPQPVTNIIVAITSAGVGLTGGQNFAALFDANGNLLGVTGDQSAVWNSSGTKTMALTAPVVVPAGTYYVGFWCNAATTAPSFARNANLGGSAPVNVGLAAAATRFGSANTGLTTTAPNPFAGLAGSAVAWWAALS